MSVNGLYIVQGECNAVVAQLRRAHRVWPHQQSLHAPPLIDEQDPLLRTFADLRDVLNSVKDLADMNPDNFLSPFLDVIRSDQTSGLVTGRALASVAKFLGYGLVDSNSIKATNAVENIADAVTHAKFVGGSDTGSDEVVLLKILEVLRTLMLSPVGRLLSNESVCEIMQSCFRICFESRLSELLRKSAESALANMIQLLFTRLPTFEEDRRHPYIRKLLMRNDGRKRRSKTTKKKRLKSRSGEVAETLKPALKRCSHELNEGETDNNVVPDASVIGHSCEMVEKQIDNEVQPAISTVLTNTTDVDDRVVDVYDGTLGFVPDDDVSKVDPVDLPAVNYSSLALESTANYEPLIVETTNCEVEKTTKIAPTEEGGGDGAEPDDDDSASGGDDTRNVRPIRGRVNDRGVRFTVDDESVEIDTSARGGATNKTTLSHLPYGLPCVRELLRFLISLTNPLDRVNSESMILMGLNLLTVALEAGADYLGKYSLLMPLVRNELCRALLQLLDTDKLPIFAASSSVCFLLFESLRTYLKFQLECYFHKLMSIVTSEQSRISYEQKEMALESLVQLWRIPGLVTELYLNYDCDLYCSNLFEDLTKLLLKNAFPVAGLHSTHILSLDALLTVVETIDANCIYRSSGMVTKLPSDDQQSHLVLPIVSGYSIGREITRNYSMSSVDADDDKRIIDHTNVIGTDEHYNEGISDAIALVNMVRPNRMPLSTNIPTMIEIIDRKKKKRILTEGTDLFNQNPKKGIEFLESKGIFHSPPNAEEIVDWLRENPHLDKKKIADYICNRKNADCLEKFVRSFPLENARLDIALRMFLETFRLPGEAAEISMVMTHFADHWHKANDEPFNHADAAFTLSYAIIMLNTDQHNPQVRRNQPPMTVDCFKRNLSGTNAGEDFDPEMLDDIYHAIRNEEIVMPAEQVGLVRENYVWKVLLRRGETVEGQFIHAPNGWNDHDLFSIIWGPATAALSFVFEKSDQDAILQKALSGYRKCASIAAYYGMSDVFDNLIISLCKYSTLMTSIEGGMDGQNIELHRMGTSSANDTLSIDSIAIAFGENLKAQMATKAMFQLVHTHGDILKEGWKNILDCVLHLFRARLLPKTLTEVEDFVDAKGWVSIVRKPVAKIPSSRSDTGLLSWFGLGGSSGDSRDNRRTTPDERELIKRAQMVIAECHPEQLITDGKYLTKSALIELLNAIVRASNITVMSTTTTTSTQSQSPSKNASTLTASTEDALVFYLEVMIGVVLENKDRLSTIWPIVRRHIQWLLSNFSNSLPVVERSVVGLLRLTNRNLFRLRDATADEVLQSLGMLQNLRPQMIFFLSKQISFGLHELLRTNAANVHRREHWAILFALIEAAGAAAYPDGPELSTNDERIVNDQQQQHHHSDTEQLQQQQLPSSFNRSSHSHHHHHHDDRGYTSDIDHRVSESSSISAAPNRADSAVSLSGSNEWIHVDHSDSPASINRTTPAGSTTTTSKIFDRGTTVLRPNLGRHEPMAFLKCCETIAFLVRDAVHITPDNFDSCVQCLRTFVEASLDGGRYASGPLGGDVHESLMSSSSTIASKHRQSRVDQRSNKIATNIATASKRQEMSLVSPRHVSPSKVDTTDSDAVGPILEQQKLSDSYYQVSHQLIDLCHTLHVKAGAKFRSWSETDTNIDSSSRAIWEHCWRPLLQCIARLCCDCRRQIRTQSLNYLVRAFLIPDLQSMEPAQWENCFGEVLFPLLHKLLDNISPMDPLGMEETRVRAMQLLSKVLLNHLSPLSSLGTFPALWLRILDFMDRYLNTERSDLLCEAVPESLKNMILVLDNTGMFLAIPGLYQMTTQRLGTMLPDLIGEILPNPSIDPTMVDGQRTQTTIEESLSTADVSRNDSSMTAAAIDLEEVVVHSGATSPITLSTSASSTMMTSIANPLPPFSSGMMMMLPSTPPHTNEQQQTSTIGTSGSSRLSATSTSFTHHPIILLPPTGGGVSMPNIGDQLSSPTTDR